MKNILKLLVVLAAAAMATLSSCSKEDSNVCPLHAVDIFRSGEANVTLHYTGGNSQGYTIGLDHTVAYPSCELVKITGKALADKTCVRVNGSLHYFDKGEEFEIFPLK